MEYTPLSIGKIKNNMLIGELSEKTGFSRDTIRLYEKQGLISVGRKERRENNYKEYSPETYKQLLTIKVIKGFGFALNKTAEFLDLIKNNQASCENVAQKVEEKVKMIDQKIRELQDLKAVLIHSVSSCQSCCQPSSDQNCDLLIANT